MVAYAKIKGGKCLSKAYVNVGSKLEWQCSKGHVFSSTPNSVQQGSWCPFCAGHNKTITQMADLARTHGGDCLSPEYIPQKKLKWRCKFGHEWSATASTIIQGHWCGKCVKVEAANRYKRTNAELNRIAKIHGGTCLSKDYKNDKSKAEWKCKMGHTWFARPSHVKAGAWCPTCANLRTRDKLKTPINTYRAYALAKGGKCLSLDCKNSREKLSWKCGIGHTWLASPANVIRGSWCPECASNKRRGLKMLKN
jgi:hypothetical protein